MVVSLIAAVAVNGVIGREGRLPWHLPDDMKRFKRLTMGHAVVMGHATYRSLGRPLPGRRNIVLSRDAALHIEGCNVVHDAGEALAAPEAPTVPTTHAIPDDDELFVIGGAAIYALFLPFAERLYITWVDSAVEGDAFFPPVDWGEWSVLSESAADAADGALPHRFVDYGRREP